MLYRGEQRYLPLKSEKRPLSIRGKAASWGAADTRRQTAAPHSEGQIQVHPHFPPQQLLAVDFNKQLPQAGLTENLKGEDVH